MSRCLRVRVSVAEELLKAARAYGLVRKGLKPKRVGEEFLLPISDNVSESLIRSLASRFDGEVCVENFEESAKGRTYKDLLKGKLPPHVLSRLPSSYEIIGNAALIQIPDDLMSYSKLVAEAIMSVAKNVKAVYAAGQVTGEFRVRPLKLIGGEAITEVIHKEYGVRIKVDLMRVYYNSSLAEEHRRVALMVKEGEVVADLFCGVGPFTLHIITSVNALVYSVDINPHAIRCLMESIKLNRRRVRGCSVPLIMDAREFLAHSYPEAFDRVIMNLPHKAFKFLNQVKGMVRVGGAIHLYVIAGSGEGAVSVALSESSGGLKPVNTLRVLDYAPRKYVFRVDLIRTS